MSLKESILDLLQNSAVSEHYQKIYDALLIEIFNNTLLDYLLAAFTFTALAMFLLITKKIAIVRFEKFAQKTATDFDDMLAHAFNYVNSWAIVTISLFVASLSLKLNPMLHIFVRYLMILVVTFQAVKILQTIAVYILRKTYARARPSDEASEIVIKNMSYGIRFGLWVLAGIFILDNFGINITTLVAGLGIGGIAVAMASQAILGDAFSAISIYIDKPFEVGDAIVVDGFNGKVEHIGIKTTRLRSVDGEQIIFSNSNLTSSRVKNYKRMRERRIAFKIGVPYNTSTEKAKKIPDLIRNIFSKMEKVRVDRIHFQAFGETALIYEIVYYVLTPDYNFYMDCQQEFNLKLKEIFEQEGIELAYTKPITLTAL